MSQSIKYLISRKQKIKNNCIEFSNYLDYNET